MVRYLSDNRYTQIPTISMTNIDYLNELLIGSKLQIVIQILNYKGINGVIRKLHGTYIRVKQKVISMKKTKCLIYKTKNYK